MNTQSLSLRKLSIMMFLLLVAMAAIFGYSTLKISSQVEEIDTSWHSFKAQHAEKARLINGLHGALGYGGMIHDFKNYLLRKDFHNFIKLERSMGVAQGVVKQYQALVSTQTEKLALLDIEDMLNNYLMRIDIIRDAISKGLPVSEIDQLVKIDDSLALRGLEVLRNEIIAEYDFYHDMTRKPVLAAAIRVELGYGGMIHNFKNYILRKDKQDREQVIVSIAKLESYIKDYSTLEPTVGETTALEDILKTIYLYQTKLELIDQGIANQISSEKIDSQVRVDDKYALRGLQILDQDNIIQIDKKSEQLSEMIQKVIRSEKINGIVVIISTLMLASYMIWMFFNKIIYPIKDVSKKMIKIADGNITFDADELDRIRKQLFEIDRMYQSLEIFKKNELRRRDVEEAIKHLAMTDPLTGLANRNELEKRHTELVALAKREKKQLAYLGLDLDMFKPINDKYGHAAGDLVLTTVAQRLQLAVRETDLVARLGGDEFFIILYAPDDIKSVEQLANRILKLIPSPIQFEKELLSVGISIGIAMNSDEDDRGLDIAMKNADKALYQAKDAGRNRFSIFSQQSTIKQNDS